MKKLLIFKSLIIFALSLISCDYFTIKASYKLDTDGDSISQDIDNCKDIENEDQLDTDQDGVGDACDFCVNAADPTNIDTDLDGLGDVCDNCPEIANLEQDDHESDGIGDVCDLDDDNDGVNEEGSDHVCLDFETDECNDNCLLVFNPDQSDINNNGVGDACDEFEDFPRLVTHFKFENDQELLSDSSGFGNYGLISWASPEADGNYRITNQNCLGYSMNFNGTENGASNQVEIPINRSLVLDESVTILFWLESAIDIERIDDEQNKEFLLVKKDESFEMFFKTYEETMSLVCGFGEVQVEAEVTFDELAHHVACRADTDADLLSIFFDGEEIGSAEFLEEVLDNENSIHIGALVNDQYPETTFRGIMDEFMLYNTALDDHEIQEQANTTFCSSY